MTTTIIIPLDNPGPELLPMLQSLVSTTPADSYDVVFVDTGSTDGTLDLLAQLDGDMKVITVPAGSSLARCVNAGLLHASRIFAVLAPVTSRFQTGWFDQMQQALWTSALATLQNESLDIAGFRLDILREHKGLNEHVPSSEMLDEYETRLNAAALLQQEALSYEIGPDVLGTGVGSSLALVMAAAKHDPDMGELPESAAERLRERLWQEEERALLLRARAGRDVCWTDEGDAEPLVTVRIATYNRAEELMEVALPSAMAQTYENLDIIVVGDHTDDATVKAMQSVRDERVRFFNLPAQSLYPTDRRGHWMVHGSPAMNLGIELALGSWITPMDDDDAMTPDHVEVLLEHCRDNRLEFAWSQTLMEEHDGWQVLGSEPLGPGATTSGAVMWTSGLRFMRMSTTCWKFGEPHDQNMWRRMYEIGVKMGFCKRITYRYSPCLMDTRNPSDLIAAANVG